MNPQNSNENAPTQLRLEPGAFAKELNAVITPNKVGWSGDNHIDFLTRLLPHLKDSGGSTATITPALRNILGLVFRPTEDLQRDVLRQGFGDAGYVLDAEIEKILVLMFSTAQFGDFLAKTPNPQTGKPFITKDKKRGAKKNTFTSLIALPPEPAPHSPPSHNAAPAETQDEAPPEQAQVEPESMEPPTVGPKPPTTKGPARK